MKCPKKNRLPDHVKVVRNEIVKLAKRIEDAESHGVDSSELKKELMEAMIVHKYVTTDFMGRRLF